MALPDLPTLALCVTLSGFGAQPPYSLYFDGTQSTLGLLRRRVFLMPADVQLGVILTFALAAVNAAPVALCIVWTALRVTALYVSKGAMLTYALQPVNTAPVVICIY
ncbi:hypothetical protein R3P38DRAFT_3082779, partial [Favolaschia claudopus]